MKPKHDKNAHTCAKPKPSYATLERKLRLARAEQAKSEHWRQVEMAKRLELRAEISRLRALLQKWMDAETDRTWAKLLSEKVGSISDKNKECVCAETSSRNCPVHQDMLVSVDSQYWVCDGFKPIPVKTAWANWRPEENI